ncbi:MAG TPA: DUF952 domain-containing protein [Anaerolineaceae bacterium]
MTELIYHITSRSSWSAAQKFGAYSADSLTSQGFIHCSKLHQILRVANSIFTNQRGLVILVIDPSQLKLEVRWEPGTDKSDELFPHLYGPLNLEAVVGVLDFEPAPDGMFSLPAELT